MAQISGSTVSKMGSFCVRYAFQAAIYALWREQNRIKYGGKSMVIYVLKKLVDKGVRNKLSLMRGKKGRSMDVLSNSGLVLECIGVD